MKRSALLLLLTALLLSGCSEEPEVTVPTAATEPTAITEETTFIEPTGYYDPDSALEASSQGAVRLYPLNRTDAEAVYPMGDDLLLVSGAEGTTLSLLGGSTLYVQEAANLDCCVVPSSPAFSAGEKGVTYFDEPHHCLVFLDASLKEVSRVSLPEEISGQPCLSDNRKSLYYCTTDTLRVIDLETGLDKLLREMLYADQTLRGLHCADTILEYTVQESGGTKKNLFIDVTTGETVAETEADSVLWTFDDRYFVSRYDGAYRELLTGTTDQEPSILLQNNYGAEIYPVLNDRGIVSLTAGDQLTLEYYDLTTGIRTALLQLPGVTNIRGIQADPEKDCIWFLGYDSSYESDVLYRWDFLKSPAGDPNIYLTSRSNAENPDTAGLEACTQTAEALSDKYGVEILLWQDAVATQSWDYTLVGEYQVPLIRHSLEILDHALSCFPDGFLKSAAYRTESRRLKICLVREIVGNPEAGVLQNATGIQFWDENEDAYIILALGDRMEQSFYHEVFHIMESRVLSRSSAYDNWNSLNPEGFDYDYDYIRNLSRQDTQWTEGTDRAFIDLYSMSFPKEDRARIMEYAMMSGNEACFSSETMQNKLRQLCIGIRDAFRLEKSTEIFRWEQYLAEPIANS